MLKVLNIMILVLSMTSILVSADNEVQDNRFDLNIGVQNYQPTALLFIHFYVDDNASTKELYTNIKEVVRNDLGNSGMFQISFYDSLGLLLTHNTKWSDFLDSWHSDIYRGFRATLFGKVIKVMHNQQSMYAIEVVLLDNITNKSLKIRYFVPNNYTVQDYYQVAHDIANEINKFNYGRESYFNKGLIYAHDNELFISDYDGKFKHLISKAEGKVYYPVFSYNDQLIAYTQFKKGMSELFLYDILFDKHIKVGNFKGLVIAPVFSPFSDELLFSVANNGSTHIYQLNLRTRKLQKFTKGYSINLSGGYSPDGKYMVFSSDRIANIPKLFLMINDQQHKIIKLSKDSGSYYDGIFSPSLNLVLYTKYAVGKYFIGLMNLKGQYKEILTDRGIENPRWANTGRHIVYHKLFKKDKNNHDYYTIQILDLISENKINVKLGHSAKWPSFSNKIRQDTKKNTEKIIF